MKRLPIALTTFSEIIKDNYLYIDKTKYIYDLLHAPKYLFLSRPRRFGKSLLISTLEELFSGNKDLFKNLDIYNLDYDWKKFPIIRIDFTVGMRLDSSKLFEEDLNASLKSIAEKYNISLNHTGAVPNLNQLITELSKIEKVVILLDEYDAPITRNIENLQILEENRILLQSFYAAIKGLDQYIHKFFMTGVTKVAQASLFSGPNQVTDISLLKEYQAIVGYTQEEINNYFGDRIDSLSEYLNISSTELKDKIKFWYNGYNFTGFDPKVYNPFSILNFFEHSRSLRNIYSNYWVKTGTTSYLYAIAQKNISDLAQITDQLINNEPIEVPESNLESFKPENVPLNALLFQSGYLTINKYENDKYYLYYPNNEVKVALEQYLLESLFNSEIKTINSFKTLIHHSLEINDLDLFFTELDIIMANISYDFKKISNSEAYYHLIIHIILTIANLKPSSEERTNIARMDLTVETEKYRYIFEFKVNKTPEEALKQIEDRKYYKKYLKSDKTIILVGASVDRTTQEISWISQELPKK